MLIVLYTGLSHPALVSFPLPFPFFVPFVSHSSLNSVNSSDSRSSGSHSHSPSSHYRYRSSNLPQQAPMRLSSVSSHDSGFMSQDAFQSKSPSPMPPEAPNQVRASMRTKTWAWAGLCNLAHLSQKGSGVVLGYLGVRINTEGEVCLTALRPSKSLASSWSDLCCFCS